MIEKFKIIGLFNDRNIKINFSKNEKVKILIGENGTGKTHILNILYYILSGKLNKLLDIEFDEIILKIKDIDIIQITKKEINSYFNYSKNEHGCGCRLKRHLNQSKQDEMRDMFKKEYSSSEILKSGIFDNLKRKYPSFKIIDMINEARITYNKNYGLEGEGSLKESQINIKMIIEKVKELSEKYSFIYLPTYRRVEEDLEKLGLGDIVDEVERMDRNTFIQFGMEDTKKYIKILTDDITKLSLEGFSEMSGDIINNLVDNDSSTITDSDKNIIKNINTLNIILNRSRDITKKNKDIILKKVQDNKIFNDDNKQLLSYLTKLIKIYNKQKEKDELIRKFTNICSKYLVGKNYHYDESLVKVYIENETTKDPLEIDTLSSGEKQLVSIFAKIYLECKKDFILFIDEPEISISMEWQKMLLKDILASKKCKLLFATTHSPFIYSDKDNKLIKHTVDVVLESTKPYLKSNHE